VYQSVAKRAIDIAVSGVALVALSPVLALIALIIYLEDRHTPLFKQARVGRDGETFRVLKFRTMPIDTPDLPSVGSGALSITRVGRVLRRSNLDELPQLINIFRGDMSLVGPRPALPVQRELIELRTESGAIRCRPGLTGLAQINSYDGMPEDVKARFDAEYAGGVRLSNDLRIILRTFIYLTRPPPVY
jgi:O-antigen biosynthesis protein WbqP